jgi:hypothetical protein
MEKKSETSMEKKYRKIKIVGKGNFGQAVLV